MQVAAKSARGLSTFLLEMALDESRMRERFAAKLLAERTRRGGGDARRYPQPQMAELLGTTLRSYQGWEAGERMPRWRNLERIAATLAWNVSELFEDDELPPEPEADRLTALEAKVSAGFHALEEAIEQLAAQLRRRGRTGG